MHDKNSPRRFGIVGGLGALGAADVFFKLVKALPARSGQQQPELIFEQRPFREDDEPGTISASQNGRKLYVFEMLRQFEARKVDAVILPCFLSHTFLDELKTEIRLPVIDIMLALHRHLVHRHARVRKLGILTSDYVRGKGLFERYFPTAQWDLVYPQATVQRECVMAAIYGADGIKAGQLQGRSVERLAAACADLVEQGAELIVPGFAEVPIVNDALLERGFPVLDTNQIYARHAVSQDALPDRRPFKIGVVGGVGPAATVDFVAKIVRNTEARRDQEHVKLVVEQNPQIPDRTEHLIGDGPDPTIALYSTCKKLEAADADIIAIPCNTAHAFVERIQPYLSIPVVNMLDETVEHIRRRFGGDTLVGLLATSGTVGSGVYHAAAKKAELRLLVPDDAHQALVMNAIYGPKGAKAGFTEGECVGELRHALASLAERGAEVLILGCTELPLLLTADQAYVVQGRTVAVLDPTEILAKRCVALSGRN
ncbi:aspartate/glutamate racemase family protein [Azoarcus sp. KH32C]|uniref:aspartate/glutamate racemase family protein n=1 Tax=Azoarcus sp. KH32C TaxID=748247 RepID=UPI000238686B|nr:amino acid racemase [Azoarcus sp. KH32C]BAL25313.1 aspartate racemase [Azoarcus sp. KH32C]